MGAGKTTAARAAAAALGAPRGRLRPRCSRSGSACRSRTTSPSHGEAAFRERRGGGRLRAARARRPGPVISLGGGAVAPSACARRSRATRSCCSTSTPTTAWQRAGGRRPLARDRDALRRRCTPSAGPLYERLADAILTDSSRDVVRRAVPAIDALRDAPAGTRMRLGAQRVGRLPGATSGDGVLGARAAPRGRAPVPRHRRDRRRRSTRARVGDAAATLAIPPGEAAKTWEQAGRVLRGARRPRAWSTTTTWSRSAAASSATSPASAPRPTSAASRSCRCRRRSSRRSTPPTAARPASTCPRARTTPAPTTSRRPCSPTRRRSRRCRRRSSPPAGPR